MKPWLLYAIIGLSALLALAGVSFLTYLLTLRSTAKRLEYFQNDLLARQVNEEENLYRRLWDAQAQYYAQEDTPQPQPFLQRT